MAIRYHYDLYPRTDPRDGTRTRRFTKLQRAIYRDVIGVGSGAADIRSTETEAADLDPRGEQYIRVVREDTVAETELVVGGWWVNRYNHDTAVARQTKRLTFAGAGTMAYLARARMWSHTYMWELDNEFVPQDPFDDIWRLWAQGNWAGGDYLGAVLWRVIQEALHYRTGSTYTHRHADGETYTDAHDDDRTATQGSSIEFVTLGFDQYEDSDGTPWTWPSGEFQASVGESVLSVVQRIMQAGLYIEMDPDTFELRAWQGRPASKGGRSTDRTGSAWATGVVRFQAPTDGTVATGNMLSDSEREINSHLPRHIILAGGQDTYARAIAAIGNGIRWEGFESSTATDVDALEQIAATQITAREEAADAGSIRMKLGTSQVSGKYRPWEEVRLDDLVTVHTGTGEWDYDEATYPVAGLKIELRKSGAWWAWAELGASFSPGSERKFQTAPVAAHSHPPNPKLCTANNVILDTGTDWKMTPLDTLPVGWRLVGFDDSAYANAVNVTSGTWVDPTSSRWVWNASGAGADEGDRNFRTEFQSSGVPLVASLVLAADGSCDVYINGTLAASHTGFVATGTYAVDTSLFVAGTNCISVEGTNAPAGGGSNPGGVYAVLTFSDNALIGSDTCAARGDHNHLTETLLTEETDTALVLKPDGTGGVEWGTDVGGTGVGNLWTMSKTASQTLTSNADTAITFDRSDIDGGSSVIDLANDRFVVPATGLYLVLANWHWEATVPNGAGRIAIAVNGTIVPNLIRLNGGSQGSTGGLAGSVPLSLTASDLVTMIIHPGAAVTPTARGNASRTLSTSFTLVRIA